MLIEFSVENYKSFRDRTHFSMEATADRKHPDNIIDGSKPGILKTAAMYGANASGKTKLFEAIWMCKLFVIGSHTHNVNVQLNHTPFVFDDGRKGRPTYFETVFTAGGVRYKYSFSYDRDRIVREELLYWPNGREALVFSRKNQNFTFNRDKEVQEANSKKVRENVLYVSVAAQFNYKIACDVVGWFGNNLMVLLSGNSYAIDELVEAMKTDQEFKNSIIRALKTADLGITDIKDKIMKGIDTQADPVFTTFPLPPVHDIWFSHSVRGSDGKVRTVDLPMALESSGTNQFVLLAGTVVGALSRCDSTLIADEMGINIHTDLCKWILGLFHDQKNNRSNSQLIFNTHYTELQDLDILRRDQIWFVEKDPDTGASSIKSLSDFRERNDKNIRNGYLAGRYGGKHFITAESPLRGAGDLVRN
ncbi:MAG: ATP-binding protein [Candidatus Methanoplasma sp.]|jgi:AAA15 family ATPase/GTPase|nr:ATP-binding protein [Candidatus Methanoplasma sp.]